MTRYAGATVALLTALAAAANAQAPQPAPTPAPAPAAAPVPCNQAVPPCGPDSLPQPGVAKGEVIKGEFAASTIYPGTWREYWVYIPAGLDRTQPAPVMIFQDGLQYQAPVVFDNLIARKAIPQMVGVFVMHGRVKSGRDDARDRMNRSYEYDSFNDTYARFLLEEMLPFVEKTHGIVLTKDPNARAIAGNSSGAIAAFAAAWTRPDAFRRVFSAIGTYVGLRGGNNVALHVRLSEPKPIRVFLQDGKNDLNNYTGDWFMTNQDMLSALTYAGYDVAHEWGDGEHNSRHATAIFPKVVEWLWKGYPGADRRQPRRRLEAGRDPAHHPGRGLAADRSRSHRGRLGARPRRGALRGDAGHQADHREARWRRAAGGRRTHAGDGADRLVRGARLRGRRDQPHALLRAEGRHRQADRRHARLPRRRGAFRRSEPALCGRRRPPAVRTPTVSRPTARRSTSSRTSTCTTSRARRTTVAPRA